MYNAFHKDVIESLQPLSFFLFKNTFLRLLYIANLIITALGFVLFLLPILWYLFLWGLSLSLIDSSSFLLITSRSRFSVFSLFSLIQCSRRQFLFEYCSCLSNLASFWRSVISCFFFFKSIFFYFIKLLKNKFHLFMKIIELLFTFNFVIISFFQISHTVGHYYEVLFSFQRDKRYFRGIQQTN